MNGLEAAELVTLVSQLCPGQKLGPGTDVAWQLVLADCTYADAKDAVVVIYRRLADIDNPVGYRRVEAAEILGECRRTWRRRLDRLDPEALVPPPGLSVAEDVEWRRRTVRAIANGAAVPTNTRGELKRRDLRELGTGGHKCTCTPAHLDGMLIHRSGCARRRTV